MLTVFAGAALAAGAFFAVGFLTGAFLAGALGVVVTAACVVFLAAASAYAFSAAASIFDWLVASAMISSLYVAMHKIRIAAAKSSFLCSAQ
ncbi:MAG: hypothetical protein AAFQ90_04295 [Pseudomonadota bacterium]